MEKSDSKGGTRKVHDEPEHFVIVESKEVLKDKMEGKLEGVYPKKMGAGSKERPPPHI